MTQTLPPAGNTSHTRPENRAFFPALDGLRAVAFLMVFGQHYVSLAWGWTGVNVFFVLSGFLITGILFDTRDDLHRFRNFYMRRALRIFPLYYGLFGVLLLLWPVMHWRWDRWWLAWPLYLGNYLLSVSPAAFVPGTPLQAAAFAHLTSRLFPRTELYLGHLWSLCVEEQFYLLWPAVVFFVRDRRRLLWICTAALILCPLLRVWLQRDAPFLATPGFTPAQADALLLGGLVALLWRGSGRGALETAARVIAPVFAVSVAAYLIFVVHGLRLYDDQYPGWYYTGGIVLADIFAASVLICALQPGRVVYRALSARPLRWIGRLSYGAYVFHDLLHGLFVHIVVHSTRRPLSYNEVTTFSGILALAATLVTAWLSFRFFESPFLNLKERWTVSGAQPEPARAQASVAAI